MVLDASVIVDLLVGAPVRRAAAAAALRGVSESHTLDLAHVEVASALRREVRRGRLPVWTATRAIADLHLLPALRHDAAPLLRRVWELRDTHSAADAAYVALAERLGVPLVTSDSRLARAHGHRAEVRDLSG